MPEPAAHTDAHAEPHDDVVPVGTYILVFLALMAATGLTVVASYWDHGLWDTAVEVLIAVTKASLVVFFFMHLKYSPKLFWVWVGAAIFFLILMLTGFASDFLAHDYLNLGNPGT